MNETQIQAQINALISQRDAFANQVVNQAGEIAVLKAELAAANALIEQNATVVDETEGEVNG